MTGAISRNLVVSLIFLLGLNFSSGQSKNSIPSLRNQERLLFPGEDPSKPLPGQIGGAPIPGQPGAAPRAGEVGSGSGPAVAAPNAANDGNGGNQDDPAIASDEPDNVQGDNGAIDGVGAGDNNGDDDQNVPSQGDQGDQKNDADSINVPSPNDDNSDVNDEPSAEEESGPNQTLLIAILSVAGSVILAFMIGLAYHKNRKTDTPVFVSMSSKGSNNISPASVQQQNVAQHDFAENHENHDEEAGRNMLAPPSINDTSSMTSIPSTSASDVNSRPISRSGSVSTALQNASLYETAIQERRGTEQSIKTLSAVPNAVSEAFSEHAPSFASSRTTLDPSTVAPPIEHDDDSLGDRSIERSVLQVASSYDALDHDDQNSNAPKTSLVDAADTILTTVLTSSVSNLHGDVDSMDQQAPKRESVSAGKANIVTPELSSERHASEVPEIVLESGFTDLGSSTMDSSILDRSDMNDESKTEEGIDNLTTFSTLPTDD